MEKAAVSQPARDWTESEAFNGHTWRIPLLLFITGLSVTLFFTLLIRSWEQSLIKKEFELYANNHLSMIQRKFDRHLEGIASLRGLYKASLLVSQSEFSEFASNHLDYHQDIQALEWAPRISHAERETFIRSVQEAGLPDYRIWEKEDQGKLIDVASRREYFPVYYVEPYQGNESDLGFDLGSDPLVRKALYQARDTGELVVSTFISSYQNNQSFYRTLLISPIYRNGELINTTDLRRKNLMGFALSVVKLGDMMEEAIADQSNLGVDFLLKDNGKPIYFHPASEKEGMTRSYREHFNEAEINWESPLNVEGAQWSVLFSPSPQFYERFQIWRSWLVLAAGILITLLVAAFQRQSALRSEQANLLATHISNSNRLLEREVNERRDLEERICYVANALSVDTGGAIFRKPA